MSGNNTPLSNDAALREGNRRAAWKYRYAERYFQNVSYDLEKIGQFDHRDMTALATLLIDITDVIGQPDSVIEAHFRSQLKELENNFILTKNPETRLPYLKKLYEKAATHYDIDWDDPKQIDNLFSSLLVQQTLGTMVDRLTSEVMSMFLSKEGAKKVDDLISLKNFANMMDFQNMVIRYDPDLCTNLDLRTEDLDASRYGNRITRPIVLAFAEATEKNSDEVVIDPTKLDVIKKHLLGDTFDIEYQAPDITEEGAFTTEHFDSNDMATSFMISLYTISGKTLNEHMTVNGAYGTSEIDKAELLLIDGQPLSDIIKHLREKENMDHKSSLEKAGNILRDALTDGHSVVSLMRPRMTEGGKIDFTHQLINVDLDKLNLIERNEKHNVFRRALDYVGIWRIKKYASNEERKEIQDEKRFSKEYLSRIRSLEEKFVSKYNERSLKTRTEEDEYNKTAKKPIPKDKFYQMFPEVSLPESREDIRDLDHSVRDAGETNRIEIGATLKARLDYELNVDKDFMEYEFVSEEENELDISVNNINAAK